MLGSMGGMAQQPQNNSEQSSIPSDQSGGAASSNPMEAFLQV